MDIAEVGMQAQISWFGLLAAAGFPRLDVRGGFAVAAGTASNADNGAVLDPASPCDAAVAWLAARGLPASVVFTGPPDESTVARLTALGGTPDRGGNEMGARMSVLDVPAGAPPGVVVEEVTTRHALRDAFGVFQDDGWFDSSEADARVAVAARLGYGPGSPVRHWIARSGVERVGAATSYTFGSGAARTVALVSCCVLRTHRRRGIATALTRARIDAAHRDGAVSAVLAPSPDGYHLHRTFGFLVAPIPRHRWFYLT